MNVSRLGLSVLWFLLLTGALSACGRNNFSDANLPSASGRFATVTNAFPGVVMVIAPEGRGLCTGMVVSERAVLTAAHCLLSAGSYTVRTSTGNHMTSVRYLNGPGDVNDTRDIGLLVFSAPITDDPSDILSIGNQVAEGDGVRIVGFGCNSIESRTGTGIKREGSNVISEKNSEYLVLLTPKTNAGARGIIGDATQSGTCFGDSGGPMLKNIGGSWRIVGVTHAGGSVSNYYFSEFVNVADYEANRSFLRNLNSQEALNIVGL
jgi:hypothetical protein